MEIYVIGTRGFPGVQGGVEKHCESLYPLIADRGCKVTVFRRKPYVHELNSGKFYHNVNLVDLFSTKNKYIETILHSFLAAIICIIKSPDVVHVHNIGPSLVLPLLKTFGCKTVVTYHSANYEHKKWGWLARKFLKFGEHLTLRLSDSVIFISRSKYLEYQTRKKRFIVNGVHIPERARTTNFINSMNLSPGRYILAVSRLSPEKGLDLLIEAYNRSNLDYPLVIAGGSDNQEDYRKKLVSMASKNERILFTGYITGDDLNEVYTHAAFFVLPSYNEGLPLAVLEALSYGLPTILSDIQPNTDLNLPEAFYFKCGNASNLKHKMEAFKENAPVQLNGEDLEEYIKRTYNWPDIAAKTLDVYQAVCGKDS